MTFASGVCAAVLSPLVTTIGFLVWEYSWPRSHSAFALNWYKCSLASLLFLGTLAVMALVHNNDNATTEVRSLSASLVTIDDDTDHSLTRQQSIGYLMLSSMIGIVIGDILWLQALTILGTVRVVFMDAIKPFGAALFGAVFLHEPVRWTILLGITLTVLGIVCIGLEQATEEERNPAGGESLPGASVLNDVASDNVRDPSSFVPVPDHPSQPTEDRVEEGSLEDALSMRMLQMPLRGIPVMIWTLLPEMASHGTVMNRSQHLVWTRIGFLRNPRIHHQQQQQLHPSFAYPFGPDIP